jgi:CIC family chloride channel protein
MLGKTWKIIMFKKNTIILKLIATFDLLAQGIAVKWVRPRVDERTYLMLVSVVVGVLAGLAAVLLKTFVHGLRHLLENNFDFEHYHIWLFFSPILGIFLCILFVNLVLKGKIEKGLSRLLFSIAKNQATMPRSATYSHLVTSALTVGFGGSCGLEAPIVITGSAIGSNTSRHLRVGSRFQNLFVACGAAAGISAVFNSPIAGVIFAFEVLLPELTVGAFIPLMMASATATIITKIFGQESIFWLPTEGWVLRGVPFYILVGLLCGLIAVYMNRVTLFVEHRARLMRNVFGKWLMGSLAVGAFIFVLPPLFGEGYDTINALFRGDYKSLLALSPFKMSAPNSEWFLVLMGIILILTKVFAMSLTVAAGGNGGIFAPSLFVGALTGFTFVRSVNLVTHLQLNEANFVAVGMAGVISGVVHAPMTAMFMIAEITGGYALIVPLMIVSSVAFFMARYIEPYSVYTKPLADNAKIEVGNRDHILLNRIATESLIEKDFIPVLKTANFREFSAAIAQSRRNVFPIVDKENIFYGIIMLDDVRSIMFDFSKYDTLKVAQFMQPAPITILPNESLQEVIKKLEEHQLWNIPVVSGEGKYLGFVSKSRLLSQYREILVQHTMSF